MSRARFRRGAAAACVLALPQTALAYCRTTTCDDNVSCETNAEDCCTRNAEGCDTNGLPLSWPTTCVSYSVQADGSKKQDITAEQTRDLVGEALATWLDVRCDGDALSMNVNYFGAVACNQQEYNSKAGNANIWLFRDDEWPYDTGGSLPDGLPVSSNALAVTTVSFNWMTGELYDADVEFNSDQVEFTLGNGNIDNDLLSIATHEAGHFLGLDHSSDWEATMTAGYAPGSIAPRSLSPDDEEGICRIYTVDRENSGASCEPHGDFSGVCGGKTGCAWAPTGGALPRGVALGALVFVGLALSRRRRAVG